MRVFACLCNGRVVPVPNFDLRCLSDARDATTGELLYHADAQLSFSVPTVGIEVLSVEPLSLFWKYHVTRWADKSTKNRIEFVHFQAIGHGPQ